METILKKIRKDEYDLNDMTWLENVDEHLKSEKDTARKEYAWRTVLAELKSKKTDYPCFGYVYFRIAIFCLINGRSYPTVLKYLDLAYKHDKNWNEIRIKKNPKHLLAEDQSAHRFAQILRCFILYKNSLDHPATIDSLLSDKAQRRAIHKVFMNAYNDTLIHEEIKTLSWKPFDKLLGRNKYRVLVEENYDGAKYLVKKFNKIHRRENLAQYGVAKAIITLCGAAVEGILANEKKVTRHVSSPRQTLGNLIWAYINNLSPKPELVAAFIFLLSIRNQIHPKNKHNKRILIDMVLARFVYRLTEYIIIQIFSSSKKRKYKELR